VAEYVVRVFASAQLLAGGVVQVTPAHGSALHFPLLQPNAQSTDEGAYWQLPVESHVPCGEYAVRRFEVAHTLAGGEAQVTAAHGLLTHWPFAQPFGQGSTVLA
jgi:hypothetical protein